MFSFLKFSLLISLVPLSSSALLKADINISASEAEYSKFCELDSKNFFSNDLLRCTNFSNFETLNSAFEIPPLISEQVGALYLKPGRPLVINSDFQLDILNASSLDYFVLDGFAGFASSPETLTTVTSLIIKNSNIEFYTADNEIIKNEHMCQDPDKYRCTFIFNKCSILNLGKANDYSNPICPAVFNNSKFEKLTIDLSSSVPLKILSLPPSSRLITALDTLRLCDNSLGVSLTKFNLTSDLLNVDLFQAMRQLVVSNLDLIFIQPIDLFKSFASIKTLKLSLSRFEEFFYRNAVEWMFSLNENVKVDLSDIESVKSGASVTGNLFIFEMNLKSANAYAFPDQDFCYFCLYPHARLISTQIVTSYFTLNTTCSLIWLTLYNRVFNMALNETSLTDFSQNETDFKVIVQRCKFDKLIYSCSLSYATNSSYDLKALSNNYTIYLGKLIGSKSSGASAQSAASHRILISFIFVFVFFLKRLSQYI
jgi:hypothetical protein